MARSGIDPNDWAALDAASTEPVYLIEISHNGLSTSEKFITSDVETVTDYGPGANLLTLTDAAAQIELPATPARIGEIVDGDWRTEGFCIISQYHGTSSTAQVVLSGWINATGFSGGTVLVEIIASNLMGKFSPVATFNEFCDYLPSDGDVLDWDSNEVVITKVPAQAPAGRSIYDMIYGGDGTF